MRWRIRRRSVSSFVSPGPRVPMPPPRRESRTPLPGEPRQQVVELRQLHLQPALPRARAPREDVEDELRAVERLAADRLLDVALLRRRQLVVEDDHVGLAPPRTAAAISSTLPRPIERRRVAPRALLDDASPTTRAPALSASSASSSTEATRRRAAAAAQSRARRARPSRRRPARRAAMVTPPSRLRRARAPELGDPHDARLAARSGCGRRSRTSGSRPAGSAGRARASGWRACRSRPRPRAAARRTRRAPGGRAPDLRPASSSSVGRGRHRHDDELLLVQDDRTALAVGQEREEAARLVQPLLGPHRARRATRRPRAGRRGRAGPARRRRGPPPRGAGAGRGTPWASGVGDSVSGSSCLRAPRAIIRSRRRSRATRPAHATWRAIPRSRTTSRARRAAPGRAAAAAPSGRGPGLAGRGSRSRGAPPAAPASALLELARVAGRAPARRRGAGVRRPRAASRSS